MSTVKRIRVIPRGRRIEGEIHRLIQEVLSERPEFLELDGGWIPRLDLYERPEAIVVEMEAPGLAPRDIMISLHPGRFEVRGAKRETPPKGGFKYLRLEREYGRFRRTLSLPCAVVPEKAKAYLEDGLLTVLMPKPRRSRDRDIVVRIDKNPE
jgi:HSP20 family protein